MTIVMTTPREAGGPRTVARRERKDHRSRLGQAQVDQVCITPGTRGAICWSRTDRDGWELLDLGAVFAHEGFYEIFFVKAGYPEQHSVSRMLSGHARIDFQMTK